MMKNSWIWTVVAIVGIAAISYSLYIALQAPELPRGFIYGNGHVEGTEIQVSAQINGRVVENHVQEGEQVEQGTMLVRLDDADLQAQLSKGLAERAAIEAGIKRIHQQLGVWRHHYRTASADLERYLKLEKTAAISPQQLNSVEDRVREAQGQVKSLEAELAQSQAQREATQQQVQWLHLQLEKAVINAPITGTILTKGIEQGELAMPGRVIAVMVDLSHLELKVYIPEGDIGRIKLGTPARVRVDAFADRYFDAVVTQIDQRAQFTPRDIHMPQERVRMVFGVTLALDSDEGYLKPGMPADAWLQVDQGADWPAQLTVPR